MRVLHGRVSRGPRGMGDVPRSLRGEGYLVALGGGVSGGLRRGGGGYLDPM